MLDSLALALGFAQEAANQVAVGCAIWREKQWFSAAAGETRTIFDLASVTKPMTALACVASGMDLSRTLACWLPELGKSSAAHTTLEELLSHRSGLEAHVKLYEPLLRGEHLECDLSKPHNVYAQAANRMQKGPGPYPAVYSDLGYMLAGHCLARNAQTEDAGAAIEVLVSAPLNLLPPAADAAAAAATSGVLATARTLGEKAKSAAPTEDVPFRGGVIRGIVHDENAWALTGTGGSGHAGIFGNIEGVLALGQDILNAEAGRGSKVLGASAQNVVRHMIAKRPQGTLLMGFDGKSATGSSAGEKMGPRTFGHLGFTGTSLWMDPDAQVIAVMLSNRVYPTRDSAAIKTARPRVHDALFDAAKGLSNAQ
jgi:serine-type D-Ala-D-Ala carboxypeptidase